MALIKCEGCGAIHEAANAVCPVCGRCPGCGQTRIPREKLPAECRTCHVPFCQGCGRCHQCGKLRPLNLEPCGCGHPKDPEKLAEVEKSFGISKPAEPHWSAGYGVVLVVLAVALLALIYWLS
jgi:hypothetical protein